MLLSDDFIYPKISTLNALKLFEFIPLWYKPIT
jgi:hypothetical protein